MSGRNILFTHTRFVHSIQNCNNIIFGPNSDAAAVKLQLEAIVVIVTHPRANQTDTATAAAEIPTFIIIISKKKKMNNFIFDIKYILCTI